KLACCYIDMDRLESLNQPGASTKSLAHPCDFQRYPASLDFFLLRQPDTGRTAQDRREKHSDHPFSFPIDRSKAVRAIYYKILLCRNMYAIPDFPLVENACE